MTSNKQKNLERLCDLQKNNWEDLRDLSTYTFKYVKYPFGIRKVAVFDDRNENLQSSRSIGFEDDKRDYQSFLKNFANNREVDRFEKLRFEEIKSLIDNKVIYLDKQKCYYEYGFRRASGFSQWKNLVSSVKGCDVVQICVDLTKDLGYDTERIDLNLEVPNLSDVGILIAYHVLEHLSDPFECIKKTFDALPSNALFHVEIPIEPDGPRIRYAHLFPFHEGDLRSMLEIAGFNVIHFENRPFPGGPAIERILAIKPM